MIHYHGGPIWPEQAGAIIWQGRHGFVSFAYPGQIKIVAEVCQSFALDNGAFSAWKKNKKYNFAGYVNWVTTWMKHPGFDFCLIPDKIDGTEEENKKLILDWELPKFLSVPVWHFHESLQHLIFLCQTFPRVALGSSGQFAQVGTIKWWERMGYIMNNICDEEGKPPCKLHGLRMLNPAIFTKIPLSSADSTNVAQNARDSRKWKGIYKPPNNISRGCLLAERIEAYSSSASYWEKRKIQLSFDNQENGINYFMGEKINE